MFLRKLLSKKKEQCSSLEAGFVELEKRAKEKQSQSIKPEMSKQECDSYQKAVAITKHYSKDFQAMLPEDKNGYTLNEKEIRLLQVFWEEAKKNNIKPNFYVNRMAGGQLDMRYKGCPFGRASLQKDKTSLQYYMGLNGRNKVIEGDLDELIPYVHKWVRYIINYL